MYAQSDLTYPKKEIRGNPTCTNGTALTDYFNSAAVKDRLISRKIRIMDKIIMASLAPLRLPCRKK